MNLRDLECFFAAADELHFGRAAERLFMAQSTLSVAIKRLETEIGAPLFARSTRRVLLTPLGEHFYEEAFNAYQSMVSAFASTQMRVQRTPDQFHIAVDAECRDLQDMVRTSMYECCPEITVIFHDISPPEQAIALRRRAVDAGLCWGAPTGAGLQCSIIGRAGFVAVVATSDCLARANSIGLQRLSTEPLIGLSRTNNPHVFEIFATAMDSLHLPWSLVATAEGAENVASRVLSGQGVGVIPRPASVQHTMPGITYVPIADTGLVIEQAVVWRRTDSESRGREMLLRILSDMVLDPANSDAIAPADGRSE